LCERSNSCGFDGRFSRPDYCADLQCVGYRDAYPRTGPHQPACLDRGSGGWHIGVLKDEDEAVRIMHAAIDEGINFFDNAWDYHDGHAEEVMGKALAMDNRRNKVFLMTKVCDRDYTGAKKCLEDSLRRLRT